MKEIKIKTKNPIEADRILQYFGILMEGGGTKDLSNYVKDLNGNYNARLLSGNLDYAKFAIKHQGYTFMEIIDEDAPEKKS